MAPGKRKARTSPASRSPAFVAPARSRFLECPCCRKSFSVHTIEDHAWGCNSPQPQQSAINEDLAQHYGDGKVAGGGDGAAREEEEEKHVPSLDPSSQRHCSGAVGSSISQSRDSAVQVLQILMEGGKRAARAERDAKIVPRSWPVELVEDILPRGKADALLKCLLHVSRGWINYPWFNNNGVEGRLHSRSCVFRLPMHTVCTTAIGVSDSEPARKKRAPEQDTEHGRFASTRHDDKEYNPNESTKKLTESSEDEEFDYYGVDAGTSKTWASCAGSPPEYREDSCTPQAGTGRPEDTPSPVSMDADSKLASQAERSSTKDQHNRDRRLTYEELMQGGIPDVAPEELLQIVPLVVEAVRRRQRKRVEEGLGGAEGLHWSPNFCICHVYDDHRSHLGAHSDTLSNIGPQAIVTGISLGAKRVFVVQETLPWGTKAAAVGDGPGALKKSIDMPHNSAVVMWGGCQERYKHGVPALPKGVGAHPIAGTKRISITLRERKEVLPEYLLPIPDCRCGVPASLKARVLSTGRVQYFYQCDRGQGQCGFMQSKALPRK